MIIQQYAFSHFGLNHPTSQLSLLAQTAITISFLIFLSQHLYDFAGTIVAFCLVLLSLLVTTPLKQLVLSLALRTGNTARNPGSQSVEEEVDLDGPDSVHSEEFELLERLDRLQRSEEEAPIRNISYRVSSQRLSQRGLQRGSQRGTQFEPLGEFQNLSRRKLKTMSAPMSYSKEQWDTKLNEIQISKTELNSLILNYLIVEGYQAAAQKFAQEAKIVPNVSLDSVHERLEIKTLIHNGKIQEAIEQINDTNPELLDTEPILHFALLRLQLIELIRTCFKTPDADIQPALDFASLHLARRAPANPAFLEDLEKTMALLCFPPDSLVPQLKELMDFKLRFAVAQQVNDALLAQQGMSGESKIKNLIKLWGWAENSLTKAGVNFPKLKPSDLI